MVASVPATGLFRPSEIVVDVAVLIKYVTLAVRPEVTPRAVTVTVDPGFCAGTVVDTKPPAPLAGDPGALKELGGSIIEMRVTVKRTDSPV
jgi:hypothetical protein